MGTAAINGEALVRLGGKPVRDPHVQTVRWGPIFPLLAKRKVVDSYDPAKWPYDPEPEYQREWEQGEA